MKSFDLVISATAFHWISPEIGYPKAAQVLKDSGYIAIFSNLHRLHTQVFFKQCKGCIKASCPNGKIPTADHQPKTRSNLQRIT